MICKFSLSSFAFVFKTCLSQHLTMIGFRSKDVVLKRTAKGRVRRKLYLFTWLHLHIEMQNIKLNSLVTRKDYLLAPHSASQELSITCSYCCTFFMEPLRNKDMVLPGRYCAVSTPKENDTRDLRQNLFEFTHVTIFCTKISHFLWRAGLITRRIFDLCYLSRESATYRIKHSPLTPTVWTSDTSRRWSQRHLP